LTLYVTYINPYIIWANKESITNIIYRPIEQCFGLGYSWIDIDMYIMNATLLIHIECLSLLLLWYIRISTFLDTKHDFLCIIKFQVLTLPKSNKNCARNSWSQTDARFPSTQLNLLYLRIISSWSSKSQKITYHF
jgi:hypothetical protein